MKQGSSTALTARYDVALLDLDGVVYVGESPVPGAPAALAACRSAGMRLAFVTNNASRTPEAVAELLIRVGVPANADEVTTSAQAAARHLAGRLPAGARVLVLGTDALRQAVDERGLVAVGSAEDEPVAVVQGYSPEMDWRRLAEATVAIRRGAFFLATNLDPTVPSPRGPLPGNGSLVAAVRIATGVTPQATGKPDPTMHAESVQRSGAQHPIVVGDRLDTDIEGARRVGCDSLLVLSGVTDARALLAAPPEGRPDYLGHDVSALLAAHPRVSVDGTAVSCGAVRVARQNGALELTGAASRDHSDPVSDDELDPLRALAVAAWELADSGGRLKEICAGDDGSSQWLARSGVG